jgi:hypothetical protein
MDVFLQVCFEITSCIRYIHIKALAKFKIGRKEEVKANNKVVTEYLVLTMNTEAPDVLRVFQLLWERAKDQGMVFDPLRKYE